MTAGAPTKYRPEMCQKIIDLGREGASITEMATKIGISRETFNVWRKDNEAFGKAVEIAVQEAQTWWEAKGREATFGGHPGFNATAWLFQMKNRFGQDYSDVQRTEISGPGGQPLVQTVQFVVIDSRDEKPLVIDHKGEG